MVSASPTLFNILQKTTVPLDKNGSAFLFILLYLRLLFERPEYYYNITIAK